MNPFSIYNDFMDRLRSRLGDRRDLSISGQFFIHIFSDSHGYYDCVYIFPMAHISHPQHPAGSRSSVGETFWPDLSIYSINKKTKLERCVKPSQTIWPSQWQSQQKGRDVRINERRTQDNLRTAQSSLRVSNKSSSIFITSSMKARRGWENIKGKKRGLSHLVNGRMKKGGIGHAAPVAPR